MILLLESQCNIVTTHCVYQLGWERGINRISPQPPDSINDSTRMKAERVEEGRIWTLGHLVGSRGVMIPALDPDPESDFQLFGVSESGPDPVKCGIVTPLEV